MSFNKPANVSYLVNEPATLTIRGTGSCRKIEIKWGDGQITTFPSHNFSERSNLVATHAYVAAGSYAVHLGDGQDATTWCYSLDAYVSVITPPVNKTLPGKGVK
jgi:PKD repeat protein